MRFASVLGTAVWLRLQVLILIRVTPARHDPFIGQQLEQFVVTPGFKKEGVIQELVPDWLCERHRDWWVLSDPCLGHSGSTGWCMCGKSPRFDASFRTSRLAWWGAALVLFLISGVVIMVWTASMWPAVLTPVILSFVCRWHSLVPFQQLRIWTWCLSGHADVTARGGYGMIFVWAGITVWLNERGLPMVPCLIPCIEECLVGCCPVAPSDLWCHYNGLDGLRAACRTDVLSIQCGQNGLASAEFALNGNGGLGTSIHDSRVGGGQAMFVKKRWLPMVVYTSLGSCPALIHCNVLVAGKV